MALKKITGKDIKEAVDWLWEHKQDGGCVHHVLGTTDDGTKLCFVVGWSNGVDYDDDDKKYGYFDEGYCISAKIGYQHRNNAMQADYDWDFNMPYDLETGDVWDTSSYVPRDADWEREAADYNKEAQKIWDAYCIPNEDGTAPLDLMESKNTKGESKMKKCSMQKKIESVSKKSEIRTSLEPRFDSRKSFYGKAQVEDDGNSKTLYSYNTPVARVTDGKLELLPKWNFSQTTRRHVADFAKQMGVEDQYLKLKKGESRCSMQKKIESLKKSEAGNSSGKTMYHICLDCIDTIEMDIEADSVEEAADIALKQCKRDVAEVWCTTAIQPDGTEINPEYIDGGWQPV